MKSRGFTLIELVVVLVLIGISSLIGLRFISDMAHSQAASAERSQALAGARFAIERLRRELSQAYSPSVYVGNNTAGEANRCISFVPVLAAGGYTGLASEGLAEFILPVNIVDHAEQLAGAYVAIDAPSASENTWTTYPATEPTSVKRITGNIDRQQITAGRLSYEQLFDATPFSFVTDPAKRTYTLLKPEQVRYCLQGEKLMRQVTKSGEWSAPSVLMLKGLRENKLFSDYNEALQLVTVELNVITRDGNLVLASQLQVNYEP